MGNKKGFEISPVIAVILFFFFVIGGCETENSSEAQFQKAVDTIESDIDEYIGQDVLMEYAGEHLDDIIGRYGLYTEDDMNSLYYDAQEAKEDAYIDGWQECCVYYGIEDEVYYTDEELNPTSDEGQDTASYDPYKNQFAAARARADASAKKMREIYVTPTGARYHFSKSCAGENAISSVIEETENQGYTPCQKCAY